MAELGLSNSRLGLEDETPDGAKAVPGVIVNADAEEEEVEGASRDLSECELDIDVRGRLSSMADSTLFEAGPFGS